MDSDPVLRRQCHSESCHKHAETTYKQKDVHALRAHIFYNPISQLHTTVSWERCLGSVLRKASHFSWTVMWDSLLVRAPTRDRKVGSSYPGRSGGIIFFSRVNFAWWLLFGVRSTPVSPQWHVKNPGHSAKNAGGRLHLNTHTPLTQRSRSGLTMSLCRHSVKTYPETSSHATCQGTHGHCRLSSLSHCGLILA